MSEIPPVEPVDPRPVQTDPGKPASRVFERFLSFVEWLGNLLPHPVSLFALFALGVVIVSAIAAATGLQVEDPRPASQGPRA